MTTVWNGVTTPGDWADGYVVDTPYIEPANSDLCPAWLSMAAVLHGQPPLPRDRVLTWVELGCGSGLSACMVAAGNADVDVWGCDVNPSHVERARDLASQAGLQNATFVETNFAELANDRTIGPGEADVIVVHGVYSWVSPAQQGHLTRIIEQQLRPGGLAYVMYEVPTGWSSMVPLAELMRLYAEADRRPGDAAFVDAVAALERLRDGAARFFPLGRREAWQFDRLTEVHARYAAHEYLGAHFAPIMFPDVDALMSDARCTYLGSVESTDHIGSFGAPPDLIPMLVDTNDLATRELLRDLANERALRRDLYRRGVSAAANAARREQWLLELRVIGLGKEFDEEKRAPVAVGEVSLQPRFHAPLVAALAEAPLGIERIREVHPGWEPDDASAALGLLVAAGYAAPMVTGWESAATGASCRRLNTVLATENRDGGDHTALVAPATGSAIESEYVEMTTWLAIADGAPSDRAQLTEHALQILAQNRRFVIEDGVAIEDRELARLAVEQRVARHLERIGGPFATLGIC